MDRKSRWKLAAVVHGLICLPPTLNSADMFFHSCMSVCVCVSACLCVCLKATRFNIPAPIATKLHTRTKDLPGKVLKPMLTARLIRRVLSKGRLFIAATASCMIAKHDVWPSTNFLHHCESEHKITAAQNLAAAEPVPAVHTATSRDM